MEARIFCFCYTEEIISLRFPECFPEIVNVDVEAYLTPYSTPYNLKKDYS